MSQRPTGRSAAGTLRTIVPAAPAVVLVVAIFVVPVASLLATSVTTPEVSLGNYSRILGEAANVTILGRTLRMALIVTVICGLLAYPYAYTMTRARGPWLVIMTLILLMPFWTSLLARSFAWVVLLQRDGPVEKLLGVFGLTEVPLLGTSVGVTIGMTQVMLPFFALPLYASLNGIDTRLVNAAVSLGAHPVVAFFRVYLPLSAPGVLGGATMVFVISLGFYVTPALLGSPRESMVAQLMAVFVDRVLDFPGAGVLAAATVVMALLVLAIGRIIPRLLSSREGGGAR